jgi:hypothetical protein
MCPSAVTPSVSWSAELTALVEQAECPVCGQSCPVEAPACVDGHGSDCPERLCLLCGTALIVHPNLSDSVRPARRRRSYIRHAA